MIVSMLDPFTATPAELRAWLARRNLEDGDDLITDVVVALAGFTSPVAGLSLGDRLRLIAELPIAIRLRRLYRTGRNKLGSYRCDLVIALDHAMFWNSLVLRLLVVAAICGGGLLAGLGLGTALLLVMAWPLTVWRGRFAFPLAAFVLGIVAWYNVSSFPYFAFAAAFCGFVRLFLWFVRAGLISVRVVESPARFLGRAFVTRAMWDRTASSILLAVTKSTYEERARAPFFIDDVLEQAPAKLRPVLVQCQALVAAGKLDFSEALRLSEQARELASKAPAAIRGWCALQSGDVLLAAGQLPAAERRWQESVDLLRTSRRAAFWLVRAEIRLIEAQTADLDDPERCLTGLQNLYRVRRRAVRVGDPVLLRKTENYLLRLMHNAGNTVGVAVQLHWEHESSGGKVDLGEGVAERTSETLLLASIMLDIIEHPERYPDDVEVTDASAYEYPAELADNALRHLSRSTEPLLEAQAFAILARVRAATGQREEALGNALESLNVVQRVRYQLPTSPWRSHWLALHAHTYALALELSSEADASLVAELLETVRAQAIPVENDEPGALLRAAFDSLLSATGLPLNPELTKYAVPVSTDPTADRTILVSGASWVGGDERATIELDQELEAMFPGGWYWSFAKAGDWVYHAVRSPNGTWFSERRPYAELEPSLTALLRQLPVEQPEGEAMDLAFSFEHANQSLSAGSVGELWELLFEALGDALIPLRIRRAAQNFDELLQIVVAPTASLALVPIAALSLGAGQHLLDVGYVAHLPSVALLAQRRASSSAGAKTAAPAEVLAVLAPHASPEEADLTFALADPPEAERTLTGPLEKMALSLALADLEDSVLYLAGHVEAPDVGDPGGTGFAFADGLLSLHDLYETTAAGTPLYPIPERVVLAGCTSLGLYADARPGLVDAPEWLGLGAAMVYGGARHVICTLYDVPDTVHTSRIDRALVDAMRFRIDPAKALRAIQRAELDRWFDGRGSMPLVFLAYAYVGTGHASAPEYGDSTLIGVRHV